MGLVHVAHYRKASAPASSSNTFSTHFDGASSVAFPNDVHTSLGSGNFSISFWINAASNNNKFILGGRNSIGGGLHITTGGYSSTVGVLRFVTNATTHLSTTVITDGTWHFCQVVRESGVIRIIIDGTTESAVADTTAMTGTSGSLIFGKNDLANSDYLTGNIFEFTITPGQAIYTDGFAPTVFPNITSAQGIVAFTTQAVEDISTYARTLTKSGSITSDEYDPYTTGYTLADYSVAFDGSGDYVSIQQTSETVIGTQDFTLEAWVRPTGSALFALFGTNTASSGGFGCYLTASNHWEMARYGDSGKTSTSTFQRNVWTHVAGVRTAGSFKFYVNGVEDTSLAQSMSSITLNDWRLGSLYGITSSAGNISNFRLTIGSALYTTNFTPPSSRLTAVSGTVFLMANKAAIKDSSNRGKILTPAGNIAVSNDNPFVSPVDYSMAFDGSGDYVTVGTASTMSFGTNAFTIECFVKCKDVSISAGASRTIIGNSGTNYQSQLYVNTSGYPIFGNTGAASMTSTVAINDRRWHHLAIVRDGTNSAMFVDGTRVATYTSSTIDFTSSTIYLGAFSTSAGFFNGLISNLRIVKGSAEYNPTSTTLTVPTERLMSTELTSLLTFTDQYLVDYATPFNTLTASGNAATYHDEPFNDTWYESDALIAADVFGKSAGTLLASTNLQRLTTGSFAPTANMVLDSSTKLHYPVSAQLNTGRVFNLTKKTGYGATTFASITNATFECWYYYGTTSTNTYVMLYRCHTDTFTDRFTIGYDMHIADVSIWNNAAGAITNWTGVTHVPNQWNHIAVTKSGSTWKLFYNGVDKGSKTATLAAHTLAQETLQITGSDTSARVDRYQITPSVKYTAAFTPL